MKKGVIISGLCLVVLTTLMVEVDFNIQPNDSRATLLLKNIEALAHDEGTKCPTPLHVPDRYLRSSGPKSVTYKSNASGEINIGGVVHGGYSKNTSVSIVVETFNCDGEQIGACCDQEKVGTFPV